MMDEEKRPLILSIDDDADIRMLLEVYLSNAGYEVVSTDSPEEALIVAEGRKPDLILLDVIMPEMNGYEFCSRLQSSKETNTIPVIFLTSLWEEADKAQAFSVGAADFMNKPIKKDILLKQVAQAISKGQEWKRMSEGHIPFHLGLSPTYFDDFIEFLKKHLMLNDEDAAKLDNVSYTNIYTVASELGITDEHLAQYIAGFLKIPYVKVVDPASLKMGILSTAFCSSKNILPTISEDGKLCFVVSNPFDWDMLDWISQCIEYADYDLAISEPKNIAPFFNIRKVEGSQLASLEFITEEDLDTLNETPKEYEELSDEDLSPIIYIADKLIHKAVTDGASDIHIEPKKEKTVVRFRINGDMVDILNLKKRTGSMLLTRLKAIGHLDIAEQKKPQDGSVETRVGGVNIKMRLATTSTPDGESLIMRVLQTKAEVRSFAELGMTKEQADGITTLANHTQGLVLVVGPTGSGKTTTIYSLLSLVDCQTRSLLSIEDPVEYRIPYANQQEVDIKRGVTFEALLKSVVRQDPDIMFLGEVRDSFSANMSMDFASTGHLTITSLHTNNAVTALFRLERLGLTRSAMADSIIGVIAQRLVKKLCPYCKKMEPPNQKEIEILKIFTDDIPDKVAHPNGCLKCNHTGYGGREGVYEILNIDLDIAQLIRDGVDIPEIRRFLFKRGDYLISTQTLEKIRNGLFTVEDSYERVLIEDMNYYIEARRADDEKSIADPEAEVDTEFTPPDDPVLLNETSEEASPSDDEETVDAPLSNDSIGQQAEDVKQIQPTADSVGKSSQLLENNDLPTMIGVECRKKKDQERLAESSNSPQKSILIVDDDEDVRMLLNHYLANAGYATVIANDGVDALMKIGKYSFDLILSDVDMPNLDGFRLMEMLNSQKIETPVVFLTANDDAEHELEGLKLGAAEYLKKPIEKDVLILRVGRLIRSG